MVASIILVGFIFMSLGTELALNGKPRTGNHSFGYQLIASVIELLLLYYAGVFDCFIG